MSNFNGEKNSYKVSISLGEIDWLPQPLANSICSMELSSPQGEVIYSGQPEINLELNSGVYRARIFFCGRSKDTLFIVSKESSNKVIASPPKTPTTFEYSPTKASKSYKNIENYPFALTPISERSNIFGSVSITVLDISAECDGKTNSISDFILACHRLKIFSARRSEYLEVAEFERQKTIVFQDEKSITFGESLYPGRYRLRLETSKQKVRWLPIYIASGHECKIVINWKNDFILDSIFIYYLNLSEIENISKNKVIQSIIVSDYLLQTLGSENRELSLSKDQLEAYISENPTNLFIGIIGLYIIALRGETSKHSMEPLITKLSFIYPDLPDIAAILLLTNKGAPVEVSQRDIPILRAGAMPLYDFFLNCEDEASISSDLESYYVGQQSTTLWSISNQEIVESDFSARHATLTARRPLSYGASPAEINLSKLSNSSFTAGEKPNIKKIPAWLEKAVIESFSSTEVKLKRPDRVYEVAQKFKILPNTVKRIIGEDSSRSIKSN